MSKEVRRTILAMGTWQHEKKYRLGWLVLISEAIGSLLLRDEGRTADSAASRGTLPSSRLATGSFGEEPDVGVGI